MKKFLVMLGIVLVLGACSGAKEESSGHGSVEDGEAANEYGSIDHGVDDKQVGFNMLGDTVEEAAGVPAAEKEKILEAFDIYIDTFNNKDIDGYLNLLAEHYDKEEQREYMTEEVFSEYDVKREASDVTIVKYSEEEAQVFAKLKTEMKQLSTGLDISPSGRQVTVFVKEDGRWKVGPIHFIGDDQLK